LGIYTDIKNQDRKDEEDGTLREKYALIRLYIPDTPRYMALERS
jgi:hypothetical protein